MGLFALLPLTVVFGHRGVAPWLLLAALPAFARGDFWQSAFGQILDSPDIKRPFFASFVAILFFCFWIFLSGFWSPKGQLTLVFYVLVPVLVGGSVIWFSSRLPPLWAYRLSIGFALAVIAGVTVLFFEGVTGGFLRSVLPPDDPSPDRHRDIIALGRGVTALAPALFAASAIAAMLVNKKAGVAVVFLGFLAAFSNDVDANVSALAAGTAAALFTYFAPRIAPMTIAAGIIALLLMAPLYGFIPVDAVMARFGETAPPSWLHRIAVWQSVGARIPEGLPFGFGADFARIWKETAPMIIVPGAAIEVSLMPTHPHNIFLQVWLELGLPGVLSLSAAIFFGARALQKAMLPRAVAVSAAGAAGVIASSFLVEGSLWQVWRLAAIALAGMGVALSLSLYRLRTFR